MTRRKSISTAKRARIFANADGICCECGERIDGTRDRWEVQHKIPIALGGDDEDSNMAPAHYGCHRRVTAEKDIPQIAKAKRVKAKHEGAYRSRNPLPGGRGSKWKKPFNGPPIRRET